MIDLKPLLRLRLDPDVEVDALAVDDVFTLANLGTARRSSHHAAPSPSSGTSSMNSTRRACVGSGNGSGTPGDGGRCPRASGMGRSCCRGGAIGQAWARTSSVSETVMTPAYIGLLQPVDRELRA